MESFATLFNGFANYCCKPLHIRCLWWSSWLHLWKECNMNKVQQKKLQHVKSATEEECKTETLQRVKMRHEIVQYKKKSATRKKVQHERITTQKSATRKWCGMKKVQHEKSAT